MDDDTRRDEVMARLREHGIVLPAADIAFLAAQMAMLARTLAAVREAAA